MGLENFGTGVRAAVFGASGGIGRAFVAALSEDAAVEAVHAVARRDPPAGEGVTPHALDVGDEAALAAAVEAMGPLHLAICTIGMLHGEGVAPEKTWRQLDAEAMTRVLRTNAVLPCLVAKHVLPALPKGRKGAFAALSARVGSIGDNRLGGWLSYRASKAALNQGIRTLSIELARRNPDALIVGLHPGTVDTGLSEPFQANVPEGQLLTPAESAARLLGVLDGIGPDRSGAVLDHRGETVPA